MAVGRKWQLLAASPVCKSELQPYGLSFTTIKVQPVRLRMKLFCEFVGVCVMKLISNSSHTFVAYKLNNCGPFILFIKVQCIFASLHQSARELQ